jgi:hypothetical protein
MPKNLFSQKRLLGRYKNITYSPGQPKPDLAIYFLNGWTYDKSPTVSLIELGKMHISVLDILS